MDVVGAAGRPGPIEAIAEDYRGLRRVIQRGSEVWSIWSTLGQVRLFVPGNAVHDHRERAPHCRQTFRVSGGQVGERFLLERIRLERAAIAAAQDLVFHRFTLGYQPDVGQHRAARATVGVRQLILQVHNRHIVDRVRYGWTTQDARLRSRSAGSQIGRRVEKISSKYDRLARLKLSLYALQNELAA